MRANKLKQIKIQNIRYVIQIHISGMTPTVFLAEAIYQKTFVRSMVITERHGIIQLVYFRVVQIKDIVPGIVPNAAVKVFLSGS